MKIYIYRTLLLSVSFFYSLAWSAPASITGTFSNAVARDGGAPWCVQFSPDNTQVRYGDTFLNFTLNECSNSATEFANKSGLQYVGVNTDVTCDAAPKQLGRFIHHNNPIQFPSAGQNPISIDDSLSTSDLDLAITIQGQTFNFSTAVAEFTETPNNRFSYPTNDFPNTPSGSCPFGGESDPNGCFDGTVVNNIASTATIIVDGESCDLTVFGFGDLYEF